MRHAFRLAFAQGTRVGEDTIHVTSIGELRLSSGSIVACDPLVSLEDAKAFTVCVPPGRYPVFATSVGDLASGVDVQLASIRFTPGDPVRWENARTRPSQDASTSEGYAVDAGVGSFCDAQARSSLPRDVDLLALLNDAPYGSLGDGDLVYFPSGTGDGVYASWFAYDAGGNVVALVTDFAGSALDERARGGPWDDDRPDDQLTEMWRYCLLLGEPTPEWWAKHAPARDLTPAWRASADGPTMMAMLEAAGHPSLDALSAIEIEQRAAMYESLDAADLAAPLRAVGSRSALRLLESRTEKTLRARFPLRTQDEAMHAAMGDPVPPEPYQRVRHARLARDRALADAIRAKVPAAPELTALLARLEHGVHRLT